MTSAIERVEEFVVFANAPAPTDRDLMEVLRLAKLGERVEQCPSSLAAGWDACLAWIKDGGS